jgi:hypothetical protein
VSRLKPGQTRSFSIQVGIQSGREEVEAVAKKIIKLQGNRRTLVQTKPEPNPLPKTGDK